MILPNHLTVFRLVLAIACPLLVLAGPGFVFPSVILFTLACLTDWWDGYLARKHSLVSDFGKILDPIADKLLLVTLFGVFAYLNFYHVIWVILIAAREIIVTAIRLLKLFRREVLPAEQLGKIKVGFQIGSIYATYLLLLYLNVMRGAKSTHLDAVLRLFNDLGIALATVMTIISGLSFVWRVIRK